MRVVTAHRNGSNCWLVTVGYCYNCMLRFDTAISATIVAFGQTCPALLSALGMVGSASSMHSISHLVGEVLACPQHCSMAI